MNILVLFGHGNKPGLLRMLKSVEERLVPGGYQFFHVIDLSNDTFADYGFDEKSCIRIRKVKRSKGFPGGLFQVGDQKSLLSFCIEKGIDLILSYTLSTLPTAIALAKKSGAPSAVWLHNHYPDASKRYGKYQLNRCDAIIAVSDFVMEGAREYLGETDKKLFVTYNGIDVEKFKLQADEHTVLESLPQFNEGGVVIGMIAAMDRNKNPQLLLNAVARIKALKPKKDLRVLLVGRFSDSGYEAETKKLAEDLGLKDETFFLGFQRNVSAIYKVLDIFVYPSYRDACPLAPMESMAWGKVVVASETGGVPEIVEAGVTGILCESGNEMQFTQAIQKLVENSDLRNEMGIKGRERVQECFSLDRLAKDVDKIFTLVAGN
ncbi:MAG: glycosyltransferase family 4 protein [bacterium]|nr:glycosyltransferase family 4 protein [bacterium]